MNLFIATIATAHGILSLGMTGSYLWSNQIEPAAGWGMAIGWSAVAAVYAFIAYVNEEVE